MDTWRRRHCKATLATTHRLDPALPLGRQINGQKAFLRYLSHARVRIRQQVLRSQAYYTAVPRDSRACSLPMSDIAVNHFASLVCVFPQLVRATAPAQARVVQKSAAPLSTTGQL